MSIQRRYDIDWIRVIVFDILIVYHIGMFFVPWDWEIKNNEIIEWIKWPMIFVNRWRLSILFLISGIGTWFALSRKNSFQFVKERFKRLFIPLLFGTLFIVSPQIYLVRTSEGFSYSSFFEFYPDFFVGIYPEGNFSWGHLWFLPYLLIITLAAVPILIGLRKASNPIVLWLRNLVNRLPLGLYIFIFPLFLVEVYLEPYYPITHALWGDWYALAHYLLCFLSGYILICMKDDFWNAAVKAKNYALLIGLISFPSMLWMWENYQSIFWIPLFATLNRWSWILVIFGYSSSFLNKASGVLQYRNQAVYPFYILHQTITITLGFFLMNSAIANYWKFLILLIGTYLGCWMIYELIIKRIRSIGPLFGMKNS
ncbi:MAG: acyltransferase family protein [Bacteroidota bacterium]